MNQYVFKAVLSGTGKYPEEAWLDAIRKFAKNPGGVPESWERKEMKGDTLFLLRPASYRVWVGGCIVVIASAEEDVQPIINSHFRKNGDDDDRTVVFSSDPENGCEDWRKNAWVIHSKFKLAEEQPARVVFVNIIEH